MILGTGTDLIRISRIRKAMENAGERFISRIFTDRERAYARKHKTGEMKFANKFAAKEAVCKALGLGIGQHRWKDIEIVNNRYGKPEVILHNRAKEYFDSVNGKSIFVSVSDTREYALAFCVIEK
jgi:holo-[acyl-carrier protein] synthase